LPDGQNSLGGIAATTARMEWSQWDPWGGLRGAAAVGLLLAAGFLTGHAAAGAVAAGGALYMGLGAFSRKSSKSIPILLTASLLMGISTFAGTWLGAWGFWFSIVIGLWAFGGGLLVAADTALWFVGVKTVITLLIAGGYASDLPHAVQRAFLVLAGGLVQTLFLLVEYHVLNRWRASRITLDPTPPFRVALRKLLQNLRWKSPAFHHALRMAVALTLGQEMGRFLFSHNAYWLPVTATIVLRPDFRQTFTRGLARVGGTFLGAGLTTLILSLSRPAHIVLVGLALIFAWLSFTFFRVNYALYGVFITGYVVFMLAFGGLPGMEVAQFRLLATLLGGGLALLVYLAWPAKTVKTG
jgi:hypothetical protein